MTVVHLVRHGQASFGAADYDVLSELGQRQAKRVGVALRERGLRPSAVRSGGLRRQRDTARLCVEAAGYPVESTVDPRWDEYDHVDVLAAYPSPEGTDHIVALVDALRGWMDDGDAGRCAESWTAFRGRVSAALAEVFETVGDGDALVVTSGGVIAAVCADLLGLDAAGFLELNIAAANTGITTVLRGRRRPTLVSFNEHAHLLSDGDREMLTYR